MAGCLFGCTEGYYFPLVFEGHIWCCSSQEPGQANSFDLWRVATAVADNVKQRTAEFASTLQDTNWKAELEEFRKVLQEDTQRTAAALESAVEHLPENVSSTSNICWTVICRQVVPDE